MPMRIRGCAAVAAAAALVACGNGAPDPAPADQGTAKNTTTMPTAPSTSTSAVRESVGTVWPVNAEVVWAWTTRDSVGGGEHVVLTRDAGATWSDITPTGLRIQTRTRRITGMFVLDPEHAWLTVGGLADGAPQTLLSTADAGRHWLRLAPTPRPTCAPEFVSARRGWCVLDRAAMGQDAFELYTTGNSGASWQHVDPDHSPPAGCDKDVGFTTATMGWAVTACAAGTPSIYRSRDGGKHWTACRVSPAGDVRNSGAMFGDIPVVVGSRGAAPFYPDRTRQPLIYRSSDAGASWQPVRPPGRTLPWHIDIRTPTSWILIHGDQRLSTDDSGRTWQRTTMDHHFGAISAGYYDFAPVIAFSTRTIGWVVESGTHRLWRTTTAGRRWTRIDIPRA